jgi:hypothetical protein
MRSVGIFEVKTKLSELLRLGEPIEITSGALSQDCSAKFSASEAGH